MSNVKPFNSHKIYCTICGKLLSDAKVIPQEKKVNIGNGFELNCNISDTLLFELYGNLICPNCHTYKLKNNEDIGE